MDIHTRRQILDRLKRGVPPTAAIEELSVGLASLREKLDGLLQPDSSPRWFYVTSEYGEGKSHFHCFAKQHALHQGYAVASLDVNNDDGALHQPQRHLSVILDSMRSPVPMFEHCQGFAEMIRTLLERESKSEALTLLSKAYSEDPFTPAGNDPYRFSDLLGAFRHDDSESPIGSWYFAELVRYLSAQDLVNKSWYGRFAVAFRLQIVQRLLVDTGHKGLLLFVDEVDNVVRQISARGHASCFRTLAWYCSADAYKALRVIFATTPEVMDMLDSHGRREYRRTIRDQKTVRPEEVRAYNRWYREAEAQSGDGWHSCPSLTTGERIELFNRIASLHQDAWAHKRRVNPKFIEALAKSPKYQTPRRWVRTVVSILDLLQQKPNHS